MHTIIVYNSTKELINSQGGMTIINVTNVATSVCDGITITTSDKTSYLFPATVALICTPQEDPQ